MSPPWFFLKWGEEWGRRGKTGAPLLFPNVYKI